MSKLVFRDPAIKTPRFGRAIVKSIVKPFQYKIVKGPVQIEPAPRTPVQQDAEELFTGFIHGKTAGSVLEERLARALDEAGLQFIYQYPVYGAYQIPGEENKIDFMVFDGPVLIPLEPRGGFVHESPSKQATDQRRIQILNEVLRRYGIKDIVQLDFDEPRDMESARKIIRDTFVRA